MTQKPKRLGDVLLDQGLISQDQIRIALTEQKRTGDPLGKLFVSLGFVTESVIKDILGEASGQTSIDISKVVVDSDAIKLISKETAERFKALPLTYDKDKNEITLAMADIFDVVALDHIGNIIGSNIKLNPKHAGENDITEAIDRFYGYELSVDGILVELDTGQVDYSKMDTNANEYDHPLVRLVNAILADAVKRGASDAHFEPEGRFLRIRYRVDGVLRQIRILHIDYWAGMAVRLKVMAGLNIAETRAPQDGRISLTLSGYEVDFRVSVHPTVHGENVVLRILDKNTSIVALDDLDIDDEALRMLKLMLARPEGIILVTGPTGSGKTTTLYSVLNYLNTERVNIMTLEDPVEYPMQLIRQTSISDGSKLDFAGGIRSMMRQDPDIILVGEIRDEDTSEMAFRAAMTGHQVFSTLHSNSAIGVIPRLLDIGVKPGVMAGNIIGIIGQRLIRKLCKFCKESYEPTEIEEMVLGHNVAGDDVKLFKAVGCDECDHTGYKGRVALMEVLKFDTDLDQLLADSAPISKIQKMAVEKGFRPLADEALLRIVDGTTSLEEVSRVIDLTHKID